MNRKGKPTGKAIDRQKGIKREELAAERNKREDTARSAAKNAGKELVKTGKISEENMKTVSRNLVPLETYVEMTNKGFKQVLEKLGQTKGSP